MKKIFTLLLLIVPALLWAQEDRVYKNLSEVKDPLAVYQLKLTHKRLKKVPPEVLTFKNLRVLDLGKNRIVTLPPEIGDLSSLEVLNLQRNHLTSVTPEIGRLKQLKRLDLSRNPLLELPDEMGTLDSLQTLVLWSTGIVSFPPTFVALDSHLKLLDMRVCPMNYDDQQAIDELLPRVRKKWDYVCNCN